MSAYRLQQYLFDQLGRWATDPDDDVDVVAYALEADELEAVGHNDIAGLYRLGVHPVLLNAWCRATGHSRDEYRSLLAPLRRPDDGRAPRWRTSV
ncbi:MAG TPA: hypothetical protein VF855_10585 [Acidimicrobiales bacterium]